MIKSWHIFALFFVIFEGLCENQIGSPCTHVSSGAPGVCKLLSDCDSIRTEIILLILPQLCDGFQATRSVVCCPIEREPGVITREKCREYSQFAFQNPTSECGHKIVKRIVGGVPSSRSEFAHMAIIGHQSKSGEEIIWSGGGTLISDRYVLTSARVKNAVESKEARYVKLGITRLTDKDHRQEFKISEFITHPAFDPSVVYNDIALIKLGKAVILNPHARPACLYTKEAVPDEEQAIASGWGRTSYGGKTTDQLLKVNLELVSSEFCNKSYKLSSVNTRMPHGIDKDSHICAGAGVAAKDTCQGDSGGPLQIYHTGDDIKCMYDVIGVTSFGMRCSGRPAAYTRVSYYVKWIEDIVWPV